MPAGCAPRPPLPPWPAPIRSWRPSKGKSTREIRRCLKRAVARQLFKPVERYDPAQDTAPPSPSVSEQQRLGPWSPERVRTWELLGRHLPPPPAVVLDIGGAAGGYAPPPAAPGHPGPLLHPPARAAP